jgi:DNA-binding response OmpR family regulator
VVFSSSASRKLEALKAGADEFILLPMDEREIELRVQSILRRSMKKGLAGNLSEVNLVDLIQMLTAAKREGKVEINSGQVFGTLCFQQGQIVYASCRDLIGEPAFLELLRGAQHNGQFTFTATALNGIKPNISKRTDHLLLGLANLLDETH